MRDQRRAEGVMWTPGVWSTDDYIREWAGRQARDAVEWIVPLQSLHGRWVARVRLDQAGQPVERMREADVHAQPDRPAGPAECEPAVA